MKKMTALILFLTLMLTLGGCGAKGSSSVQETENTRETQTQTDQAAESEQTGQSEQSEQSGQTEQTAGEWTRQGYYQDENSNFLSITYMDDIDEPGWYVGFMNGEDPVEDSYGGTLQPENGKLHGILPSGGNKEELTVTVSEEEKNGLLLTVEGGDTYHFTPMEMEEAAISVTINTDGWGNIAYTEGEADPEVDPEYPYQSAQINLAEPATHTLLAYPKKGNLFVKWTKNGEDFSTEPKITILLDESADYVAVFKEDPDWQNPVMNFAGDYQCGRAHALVESFDTDSAWVTIEWGGSASELARWIISGPLDTDTQTISYSGSSKAIVTFNEDGEEVNVEDEYEDGTGTIVFNGDGTFTWHEDQSESGEDMVFELLPAEESET